MLSIFLLKCLNIFFSHCTPVIFTPVDEYNYWKSLQENLPTKEQKKRADYFCKLLASLESSFNNAEMLSFSEFKDSLDTAYNVLDDLWKQDEYSPAFPAERMEHLLDIIGEIFLFKVIKIHMILLIKEQMNFLFLYVISL